MTRDEMEEVFFLDNQLYGLLTKRLSGGWDSARNGGIFHLTQLYGLVTLFGSVNSAPSLTFLKKTEGLCNVPYGVA
jgi:hypothetical protein